MMAWMRRAPGGLSMLLALACGHGEPFAVQEHGPDGLFAAGEPARLTFGDAVGEPAWAPDASAIVYAGGAMTGVPPDRCLMSIPATGGTIVSEVCDAAALADAVDTWAFPAISGDQLAFHYQNSVRGIAPTVAGIYVGPLVAPVVSGPVRSIPFFAPDGVFYVAASHVTWLGGEILFIGYSEQTVWPCAICDPIRVEYPLALLRGAALPGSTFAPVPGIAFPTSAVAGASSDELYFTLANDSRIYHEVLSTGTRSVVHDFGTAGIARDVSYAAGQVAAVVGGKVKVWLEPAGPLQSADEGGHLYVLDLVTGNSRRLTDDSRWFRHPAFSPTATALVGEGYAVTIDQDPASPPDAPVLDTTVTPRGDLWLYGSP